MREIVDELREQYAFEPILKYSVEVLSPLGMGYDWQDDAYFMTRNEAVRHAVELFESGLVVRVMDANSTSQFIYCGGC